MSKINGTLIKLYVGGTGTVVPNLDKVSLEQDRAMIDVTTKDSNHWKEVLPGLKSAKVSLEGLVDYAASGYPIGSLISDFQAGTTMALVITDDPVQGAVSGDKRFSVSGYFTKVSLDFPNEGAVKFTAEAVVTGPVTMASIT